MITTILVPIGALIYLKLSRFYQFVVLSLAALLPFSFGEFRSIPNLLFIEWLPIIALLILFNDLIPVNRLDKRLNIISFKGSGVFLFAIGILIVWTLVSFVDNEIFIDSYNRTKSMGTMRIYFGIFNNIILFFTTILFVTIHYDQIDFEKFFKILFFFALFLGALRLVAYSYGFWTPLLYGEFRVGGAYGMAAKTYGGQAYRLGGLNDVVSFGVPALFSYYLYSKKMNYFALVIFLFYLFMSGGRTIAIGTIVPIIVFSFIFFPRNFIYLIGVGSLLLILAFILLPETLLQGQTGRMVTFKKGFMGLDFGRILAFTKFWEIFISNPIWGKGIGNYSGFIHSELTGIKEFVDNLLIAGGHGSYLSLLAIYGVGGIIYFVILLFGGIISSYRRINQYLNQNIDKTAIAVFTFMLLMIKSFDYLTAQNGLTIPVLFFVSGFIISLTVLQNKENILNQSNEQISFKNNV